MILDGSSIVNNGSKITIEGKNFGWKIIFFIPSSSFKITEALPVSDPVPAVVGIAIIGAILATTIGGKVGMWLGFAAVVFAMINVVGGFLVTDRMLKMFKRK